MKTNLKTKLLLITFTVLIFSTISTQVLAASNIELPTAISSIALNPSANKLYGISLGTIYEINTKNDKLVGSFDLGDVLSTFNPGELKIDTKNDRLFILDSIGLHIIDGLTHNLLNDIPLTGSDFAFDPDKNKLWILNSASELSTISIVNDYNEKFSESFNVKILTIKESLIKLFFVSPDKLYAIGSKNIYLINPDSDTVTLKSNIGNNKTLGFAYNPVTKKFYLLASTKVIVFDAATSLVSATILLPNIFPLYIDEITVNESTNKVYVLADDDIDLLLIKIDGNTNKVVDILRPYDLFSISDLSIAINPVSNKIYTSIADKLTILSDSKFVTEPEYLSKFKESLNELRILIDGIGNKIKTPINQRLKQLKIKEFNKLIDSINAQKEECNAQYANALTPIPGPPSKEFERCCVNRFREKISTKLWSERSKAKILESHERGPRLCRDCMLDINHSDLFAISDILGTYNNIDLDGDEIIDICQIMDKNFEKL